MQRQSTIFDLQTKIANISINNEKTIKKGRKLKQQTEIQLNNTTQAHDEFYQRLDLDQADQSCFSFYLNDTEIAAEVTNQQEVFQIQNQSHYFNQYEKSQLSDMFKKNQELIYEKLNQKQYYLGKYLTRGGEGEIFEAVMSLSSGEIENVICKIIFDYHEKDIQEEIAIMNSFEKNINIIKLVDSFDISNSIYCLILEKCKHSLKDELSLIKDKKQLSFVKLIQMIFDLLDGLIQLRVYKILHLDIKPHNILISVNGNCVFTDFGMSSIQKEDNVVKNKGYTSKYAPQEQKEKGNISYSINYCSDIYSLGLTIQEIINAYKENEEEYKKHFKAISEFENEIKITVLDERNKRPSCVQLHYNFIKILLECNESMLLLEQTDKIQEILSLFPYDHKKDIPYYHELRQYYNEILIKIYNTLLENTQKLNGQQCQNTIETLSIEIFTLKEIEIMSNLSETYYNLSLCQMEIGKYQIALNNLQNSLKIRRIIFLNKQDIIVTTLLEIGKCYYELEYFQKALDCLKESLDISLSLYNKMHADVATAYDYLGQCYMRMKDYENSINNLQESLIIRRQVLNKNHMDIAITLENISDYYFYIEDYNKSLENMFESLEIINRNYQENHFKVATAYANIGSIYTNLNKKRQSISYQTKALQMYQEIYKGDHPEIARILNNLACLYKQNRDFDISLLYLQDAQCMAEKVFHRNHSRRNEINSSVEYCQGLLGMFSAKRNFYLTFKPLFNQSKRNRVNNPLYYYQAGVFYQQLSKYQIALKHILRAVDLILQSDQIQYDLLIGCYKIIILCYYQIGDMTNSIKYELQYLKSIKDLNQQDTRDQIVSYGNIGLYYSRIGDFDRAIQYSITAQKMCQTHNSQDDLYYAILLNTLGDSYLNLRENKSAEQYLLESLSIRKKLCKEDHFRIELVLNNLGQCYLQMDDKETAIKYQQQSLQMNYNIYQKNHHDIAASLNNLGVSNFHLGQIQKALDFLLESYYMLKQLFQKRNHPFITSCLNNIGLCYQKLGYISKFLQCGLLMYQIMSRPIKNPSYIQKTSLIQVKDMIFIKSLV